MRAVRAEAHLWRGGLDIADPFPEDARFVGYHTSIPDATALPNTPVGRLQMLQVLAGLGFFVRPDRALGMVGLDQGYGWKNDDFITAMGQAAMGMGPGGQQMNSEVATGQETAMPGEM